MTALLKVVDLEIAYGRLLAVRGLSLSVDEGEIVAIVGPNGAGKSTTLLALAGALAPRTGNINFAGQSLLGLRTEEVVRRGISLVPEGRHIFGRLTVRENLQVACSSRRDKAQFRTDAEKVLDEFPSLRARLDFPAGNLSGGEQQQLAIARAYLTRPRLMLVDEPALGLAPLVVAQVYRKLTALRDNGLTLVIVEQSLERAVAIADRVHVMRDGHIKLSRTRTDVREKGQLEEAYFGFYRSNVGGS